MILIDYKEVNETRATISRQLYNIKESYLVGENQLLVENIPTADPMLGQSFLFINPQTKEIWHEYKDEENRITQLEKENAELKKQLETCNASIAELTALATTMMPPQ